MNKESSASNSTPKFSGILAYSAELIRPPMICGGFIKEKNAEIKDQTRSSKTLQAYQKREG